MNKCSQRIILGLLIVGIIGGLFIVGRVYDRKADQEQCLAELTRRFARIDLPEWENDPCLSREHSNARIERFERRTSGAYGSIL